MKNNKFLKGKRMQQEQKLLLRSPFYGLKGSISRITKDGNYYLVTRYDTNGKDGETFPTPTKKKNEIVENYIDDIKNYLEANHTKYLMSLNQQSKKRLSKKTAILLASIFGTLAISSVVGTLFTTGVLSQAFLTSFFFTFIISYHELHVLKDCIVEEKIQDFIHEYKGYIKKVNDFNIKNDRKNRGKETIYSNVSTQEENKVIDIEKVKKLDKKSA